MIFSEGEMQRRAAILRAAMDKRDLDLVLLHSADNVYYMSGVPLLDEWGRPMWAMMAKSGEAALIGAELERENILARTWIDNVMLYDDHAPSQQAALELASSFGGRAVGAGRRIGVERSVMTMPMWDGLVGAFPGADLVDVADVLDEARIIKSPEEFTLLKLAATVAKIGASEFLDAVRPGATELGISSAATAAMDRAIAALYPEGGTSTYSYCQLGTNTLSPHLHPTGRRLVRGDVVALNVFPVIWGYCIELERTFIYGSPTAEQHAALDAVNQAFEETKRAFGPGASFRTLDENAREILAARGYGENLRHGTGHAHGIMIGSTAREELGEIRYYNDGSVRPGMANSIEPGIFVEGLGAFRHSDVMLAHEDRAELITDFPRDILMS